MNPILRQRYTLIIALLLSGITRAVPHAIEQKPDNIAISVPTTRVSNNALALLSACLALSNIYVNGSEHDKKAIRAQLQPLALAKNIITTFSTTALVTFFHEFGHAYTAYLLTGSPINIHLGKNSFHKSGTIMRIGNGIAIDGFNPNIGYTNYNTLNTIDEHAIQQEIADYCSQHHITNINSARSEIISLVKQLCGKQSAITNHQPYKEACITLAGGLCGLFANFCIKFMQHSWHASKKTSYYTIAMRATSLNYNDYAQLINMLLPVNEHFDATKFYTLLGVPPQVLHDLQETIDAQFIEMALHLIYEFNRAHGGNNPASIIQLALINNITRGYAEFSLQ